MRRPADDAAALLRTFDQHTRQPPVRITVKWEWDLGEDLSESEPTTSHPLFAACRE